MSLFAVLEHSYESDTHSSQKPKFASLVICWENVKWLPKRHFN